MKLPYYTTAAASLAAAQAIGALGQASGSSQLEVRSLQAYYGN